MTIRSDRLQAATTRRQNRIFVIESRHVIRSGKTIREIVIFDKHPASLRLLSADVTPPRRSEFVHAALTILLVVPIVLGVFWSLF